MYAQMEKSKENKNRSIANSVGQKKSYGEQEFIDNRSVVKRQRALQAICNENSKVNYSPIQRMTLVADNNKDNINDFVVMANMKYARDNDTGNHGINDMAAHNDFHNPGPLGVGEPVHVINHGGPGTVGAYDGAAIGNALTHGVRGQVAANWGDVEVYSCQSGADVGGIADTSLVNDIAANLGGTYTGTVKGRKGLALTHRDIGKRTVSTDPQERQQYLDYEAEKGNEYGLRAVGGGWKPAQQILVEDMTNRLNNKFTNVPAIRRMVNSLTVEEKAEYMENVTSRFYRSLLNRRGVFKPSRVLPQGRGERHADSTGTIRDT